MKRFLGGLVLALMLLAAPAAANAQTQRPADAAERLALANKFMALMQGDELGAAMRQMMTHFMPAESDLPDEERVVIEEVTGEVLERMVPRMLAAMAPVYAEAFTVEELRALVAFYESEVGRALVRKSYQLMPQANAAAQAVLPQMMAEMGDLMCDRFECTAAERREMKTAMAQALATR